MVDVAPGPEVRMIISKDDIEAMQVIVESAWTGEEPSVEMATSKKVNALSIGDDEASHIIHLILPRDAYRVPKLNIRAPNGIPIEFHSSVQDFEEPLHFAGLTIASEGDIAVPDNMLVKTARLHSTSGDITGSYNVSRAIVLKTITGNIDASVWVHHLPPPPHGPHGPHGPPKKEHEEDEEVVEDLFMGRRSLFGKAKNDKDHKKHDKDDKHHHHDHKPPHRPHHPPPPPPPVFVGAFSINGSIDLNVLPHRYPDPLLSVIVKSFTESGNVFVHVSRFFKGFFKAEAFDGELDLATGPNKTIEYLKEIVTEKGHIVEGLILPNGTHGPRGPPHPPKKDDEDDDDDEEEEAAEDAGFEKR